MGLFGSIMQKIFHHPAAQAAQPRRLSGTTPPLAASFAITA